MTVLVDLKRVVRTLATFGLVTCALIGQAVASQVWLGTDTEKRVLLYSHSRALLIGQSKFGTGWNELTHVPGDLKKVKKTLEEQGFDEIVVHQNLDGRDILPTIQEFVAKETGPSTRTIIYVTGHGWSAPNGATYLVGSDASLPSLTAPPQIARMLPVTALRDLHLTSRSLHTLLILDSCYSGAVLQTKSAAAPTRLVVEQMKKPVYQILASGQKDQRVAGDGVFAELFTSGLRGNAAQDRERAFVTFRQLANWLFFELPKRSNQVPVYADYPAPDGDMVFLTMRDNLTGAFTEDKAARTISQASRKEAVQQTLAAQSDNFRSLFPKTSIFYYRKASDDLRVVNAMNKLGADYVARPPELPDSLVTNGLGCGPTTPPKALKTLAKALIRDGVPIARIAPYKQADIKGGRIEILSTAYGVDPATKAWLQNLKPLSEAEIDRIDSCRVTESKR